MPQPSLSTYHPSLGERLQQGFAGLLGKVGVPARYARHVSERTLGFLNDLTPVGNATMAADAGTAIRNGHPVKGLGLGALAVLPGAASKVAKGGMFGARKAIRAWHGSPHDFDKFSLSKIGTGEGSQIYGRGLYFSEEPEVAKFYRPPAIWDKKQDRYIPQGRLYEVNINASPDELMNWDASLGEQRGAAADFLHSELNRYLGSAYDRQIENFAQKRAGDLLEATRGINATGPQLTADALSAGVPGITYLGGGNGSRFSNARNHVVFDDSLVNILNKF